jgi:uncharacterized protein YndB with AHSA1/START domain
MTAQTQAPSVRTSLVVAAPIDRAFSVFTEGMATWWPPEHHILQTELAEMVFEPRVGGNIYDRGVDGSECRWARVLAYEPPARVVFSWTNLAELGADPRRRARSIRFTSNQPVAPASISNTATSNATARLEGDAARSARPMVGPAVCGRSPFTSSAEHPTPRTDLPSSNRG